LLFSDSGDVVAGRLPPPAPPVARRPGGGRWTALADRQLRPACATPRRRSVHDQRSSSESEPEHAPRPLPEQHADLPAPPPW